jgi:hypothetical protein
MRAVSSLKLPPQIKAAMRRSRTIAFLFSAPVVILTTSALAQGFPAATHTPSSPMRVSRIGGFADSGDSNSPHASREQKHSDWLHRWLRNVDKARSEQPHYAAPLITTHPLLVQQFRFDAHYQSAPNGVRTDEYGSGRGIEIIPNTRMEVQVGLPPYFFRHAPNIPDGFGDVSIFLKLRLASAPEARGGYFLGLFLGGSFPSATPPNGMGHTVWTPMLAGGKRWSFFDWQSNLGGTLPQSGTPVLGRQIVFNNTLQLNVAKKFWPEVENNTTFYVDGPHSGKRQNFITPGLIVGPFPVAERLHFLVGGGVQIATSQFYTYNHRWIWSIRFPF